MRTERICSECSASLKGRALSTKTCSVACRAKRTRRMKREREQAATPIAQIVAGNKDIVAREVMAEEIRPIVREAINESVLEAIDKMVKLTPAAVDELASELGDEDVTVRHRAAALVTKYTIGHPALVRPPEDAPPKLEVNFALPRPGSELLQSEPEVTDSEVVRECDICNEMKPESEFYAGSDRCTACHEEIGRSVADLLAK